MRRYKDIALYLLFGVLTTAVNVAVYFVCFNLIKMPNTPSVVAAWIISVIFAYITNKLFVFESKSFLWRVIRHEVPSFFGCRALTGIFDVAIMYVAVDLLYGNSLLWKIASNIIVIVLNFAASKLFIFKSVKK